MPAAVEEEPAGGKKLDPDAKKAAKPGKKVESAEDILHVLELSEVGEEAKVVVRRKGRSETLSVKLQARAE